MSIAREHTQTSRQPRLAYLISGLGRIHRGAEALTLDLIGPLKQFYDITLFAADALDGVARRLPSVHREWSSLEHTYRHAPRLVKRLLRRVHATPTDLEMLSFTLAAQGALWRERYDALLLATGVWGARAAAVLRRLRETPFVILGHGGFWGELDNARLRPDLHILVNPEVRDALQQRLPDLRTTVIENGVSLDRFCPGPSTICWALRPPIVLAAGALDAEKRFELAIEAVAQTDASLVIAGSGELAPRLAAYGRRLLGPTRFRLTAVPRTEMPNLYRSCDAFTLPSQHETCGMVYLEALATGKPIVATDDATRRAILGNAGLVCDCTDIPTYAAALRRVLAGPLGETPRARATRFDIRRTAAEYAAAIDTVLRARRPVTTPRWSLA